MSSDEPVLFPCPKCGVGRGVGGVVCKQCGWDPDADPFARPQTEMQSAASFESAKSGNRIFGMGSITFGVLIAVSGLGFLLSTLIGNMEWPITLRIAPLIQIAMGLLMAFSGFLTLREHPNSKRLFIFSVVGWALNCLLCLVGIITLIQSNFAG